jgi:NAD(P)-dependent dehydrogenase (short-subunit alcohol dehydrogenase family)
MDFKNKVVIITGSEGDIGKALVKKFEELKYIVYGLDIKNNEDITNYSLMKRYFDSFYANYKHIDVLVNNAAITIEGYKEETWDKTLEINLKAPFILSQLVQPYMINGGSIVNITSICAEQGFSNNPSYGVSKGGLKILTKCLALDWAKYNIRVNNVGFAYVRTNMTKKSFTTPKLKKIREERMILNRYSEASEVAGVVSFLCSKEASFITGADFYIDGGFLAKGV